MSTDKTQRADAERKLREAGERYRLLFEEAPVMYIITRNVDGVPVIDDCNRHLLRTLGYSREEVVGRPLGDLYTLASNRALIEKGGYSRALSGDFLSEERQLYAKDGRVIETLLRAVPETDANHEVIGTRAMFVDVTEQRKLQAQLSHAAKMEALGRLAGGIAHDFNNLLTVISGFAQLQISKIKEESELGPLLEIKKAAERGADLTGQLLSFTRQQDAGRDVLDVNRIVAEIEALLCRTLGDDVELQIKLAPSLRRISANRGQIEQILVNLAINARDAMPRGGALTIETANRDLGEEETPSSSNPAPGEYVMIAISDNGCGMTERTLRKVFEPFFTTKPGGKGTGLGLSIVYGVVERYCGHIKVHSKPGQGSRFEIFLPATDEEPAPPPRQTEPDTVEIGDRRGTILLVEDQPEVRELMIQILEGEGFEVFAAGTAERARDLYEELSGNVDLLLSDVQLPESSGRELADQVRAFKPVRVLLISGHDPETSPEDGARPSSYPFLRKPFDGTTLIRRIRQLLNKPVDTPTE